MSAWCQKSGWSALKGAESQKWQGGHLLKGHTQSHQNEEYTVLLKTSKNQENVPR